MISFQEEDEMEDKYRTNVEYFELFAWLNIKPTQIRIMSEYYLILNDEKFNQLKNGKADIYINSSTDIEK